MAVARYESEYEASLRARRSLIARVGTSLVVSIGVHVILGMMLAGVAYTMGVSPGAGPGLKDVLMTLEPVRGDARVILPGRIGTSIESLLSDPRANAGSNAMPDLPGVGLSASLAEVLASGQAGGQAGAATGGPTGLGALTGPSSSAAAMKESAGGLGVMFAGLSAQGDRARSVVYVVDASGPMVSTLPEVFGELMRSVESLLPTQTFGVVLFREGVEASGVRTFDSVLREANGLNKSQLRAWLANVSAGGRSNPMTGLRAGLALKPQALFLLSRSITRTGGGVWDAGPTAIMGELARLNPVVAGGTRPVVIKTIQFVEPDPTGIMERIGKEHGGEGSGDGVGQESYRVLKSEELRRR